MTENLKTCPRCNKEKPANHNFFYRHRKRRDGLSFWCKLCAKEMRKKPKVIPPCPDQTKRCRDCKREYPATHKHFSKNPWAKDGLHPDCNQCRRKQHREKSESARKRYEYEQAFKHFAKNTGAEPPLKTCASCSIEYPCTKEFFYKDKRAFDGLYSHCKECHNLYTKKNYGNNRKKKAKWHKKYRQKNIEKYRVYTQKRITRKAKLPDNFTEADWQNALAHFNGRCAACGRPPGFWHTLAMDHWVPMSDPDCPGTVPNNIIPLCHGIGGCNNSKHANEPNKWLIKKFGTKKAKAIRDQIHRYFSTVGA